MYSAKPLGIGLREDTGVCLMKSDYFNLLSKNNCKVFTNKSYYKL